MLGRHRDEAWTFRSVILQLIRPEARSAADPPGELLHGGLLFGTCMMLMFIGQVPIKHMLALLGIAVAAFAVLLVLARRSRIAAALGHLGSRSRNHGSEDPDANYQVNNAKIAIVHGGMLPNGPGTGVSRNFMPHPYSDMIYAFIIDEYGSILGGLGLLLLYLILLFRAIRIATNVENVSVRCSRWASPEPRAAGLGEHGRRREPRAGHRPTAALGEHGRHLHLVHLPVLGILLSVSRSVYDEEPAPTSERVKQR